MADQKALTLIWPPVTKTAVARVIAEMNRISF